MGHIVPHRLEQGLGQERRDVVLAAGEVVVDAEHVVSLGDKPLTQMRAEKAGAAGDKYALRYSAHGSGPLGLQDQLTARNRTGCSMGEGALRPMLWYSRPAARISSWG